MSYDTKPIGSANGFCFVASGGNLSLNPTSHMKRFARRAVFNRHSHMQGKQEYSCYRHSRNAPRPSQSTHPNAVLIFCLYLLLPHPMTRHTVSFLFLIITKILVSFSRRSRYLYFALVSSTRSFLSSQSISGTP